MAGEGDSAAGSFSESLVKRVVLTVVIRVVLDVTGHRVDRDEEGPNRLLVLGCRAPGVIGPPTREPVAGRRAGKPGVVTGAWLRQVVHNVEDIAAEREPETAWE